MLKSLDPHKIEIDHEIQSRVDINQDVVREYAEMMAAGNALDANWPPVTVFWDKATYWLADGFHRVLAARQAKWVEIHADVQNGSRDDARWYAVGANTKHGLRRTNADKRRAVELAMTLRPDLPQTAIAEHCRVSRDLVREMAGNVGSYITSPKTAADGRTRPASYAIPPPPAELPPGPEEVPPGPEEVPPMPETLPPAKREALAKLQNKCLELQGLPPVPDFVVAVPVDGGEVKVTERDIPPVPDFAPPPVEDAGSAALADAGTPPPAVPEVKQELDGRGRVVPKDLRELWARRQEIQDMMTQLSRMRAKIKRAVDEEHDPLYSAMNHTAARAALNQAYAIISGALPFAVCPMCQGVGCRVCFHGIISEFKLNTVVPVERR
jgi:hypothetical protein